MKKIISKSLADQTQKYLEDRITMGKLKPGLRIKENEIAKELQISRIPVREALMNLEAGGLIVRKPRIGAFVSEITKRDIWEVYTILAALYEMSLKIAMEKFPNGSWIDRIEKNILKMIDCVKAEPPNILGYQAAHWNFHNEVLTEIGNKRLQVFMNSLQKQTKRMNYERYKDKDYLHKSMENHVKIMEAIKMKNIELSSGLTRRHIWDVIDFDPSTSERAQTPKER